MLQLICQLLFHISWHSYKYVGISCNYSSLQLKACLECECLGAEVSLNAESTKLISDLVIDAGTMEQWKADFKNTLLGSRYGWLATITGHPSAEVVLACQRPGCVEWDWPCHACTQHAHHNVWIFSQQVNTNFQQKWLTFSGRCIKASLRNQVLH